MKITFSTTPVKPASAHAAVIFVGEGGAFTPQGKALDKKTGGTLTRALKAGKFTGKKGQTTSVVAPHGVSYDRIVLVGIGKEKLTAALDWQKLGGAATAHLNAAGVKNAIIIADIAKTGALTPAAIAANLGYGARLRHYRFDKYFTNRQMEGKLTLSALTIQTDDAKTATKLYADHEAIAEGIFLTRDLVSEPANVINPETLAEKCEELKKFGLKVEVLGEPEMYKLGMHSLLGVGQGSSKESQTVIIRWEGDPKSKAKPLAFCGKGVCFDTGGISIKPANGMEEMKWDMGGAGTVIGLMRALAARKAKINAVGVVGLVENMPDGNAQRPGDVVKSMSGQTIEIQNTDAEGRLVLADILWYTQNRFKPRFMIDLATLTGAIIVALGNQTAGLFSNDDVLAGKLAALAPQVGESVWRLPLGDYFDKLIDSDIADMKNISAGREAGSITAAQFLQRFVNDVPWVHLDIAGVAWLYKDSDLAPKGAAGWGVRLLDALVREYE